MPRTGIVMNSAVNNFDPRPGRANSIAPHQRPVLDVCPVILTSEGRPVSALGASGGRRILSSRSPACLFRDRRGNVVGACLRDATHQCCRSGKIVCDAQSFPHLVLRALTECASCCNPPAGNRRIPFGFPTAVSEDWGYRPQLWNGTRTFANGCRGRRKQRAGRLRDLGGLVPGALSARRQPASWFSAGRLAEFRHSRQRMLISSSSPSASCLCQDRDANSWLLDAQGFRDSCPAGARRPYFVVRL